LNLSTVDLLRKYNTSEEPNKLVHHTNRNYHNTTDKDTSLSISNRKSVKSSLSNTIFNINKTHCTSLFSKFIGSLQTPTKKNRENSTWDSVFPFSAPPLHPLNLLPSTDLFLQASLQLFQFLNHPFSQILNSSLNQHMGHFIFSKFSIKTFS